MPTSDVLNQVHADKPNAGLTIIDQLWQQLDGAYERYRRYRAHGADLPADIDVSFMRGRCIGLVEAIATLTFPATADAVQAECLKRWKSRVDRTPAKPQD